MQMSKILKTATVAGFVGLGIAAVATPASARTYERCDYDGDRCVRIQCDWDGDDCWRTSDYYNRPYYRGYGRWICDDDGDDCRWVYYRQPYPRRHYYYGPSVGFSFRF